MLTIFGKSTSINVRKVLWTCAEIGVSYDLIEYGSGTERATNTPEFLAMNPNAMVPVIQEDGITLWESNSICRYLANKFERWDLLPQAPMARAQVEKWMDWQATELNNSWRYAFMGLVRKSPAFADPAGIAQSSQSWNQQMGIIEQQLKAQGPFINGEHFSLADVVLGLSLNRWKLTPIEHAQLPYVDAYYARLGERPGFVLHGCNGIP